MENGKIQAVHFAHDSDKPLSSPDRFGPKTAEKARCFHRSRAHGQWRLIRRTAVTKYGC